MTEFVANMLLEWDTVQPPLVERVLWVDYTSRQLMTIEIEHRRKKQHRNKYESLLPVRREMAELEVAIMEQQVRISNHDPYACLLKPDDEFDPEILKLRDHAYQLIAPLVEQHYEELFDPERRGDLIAEESTNQGISKSLIYQRLHRYWQGGQTPNVFFPLAHLRGKTDETNQQETRKRGRTSKRSLEAGRTLEGSLTEAWRAHIRNGIKRFYQGKHRSLKEAWMETLTTYFSYLMVSSEDGSTSSTLLPEHERPTLWQFYTVYAETRDTKAAIIGREGERAYNLRHRPAGGKSTQMSSGPGALLQLDSTLADVYLVSSLNRRWIIGRPVITIIIDVFSRMIVGFNVSLKSPGWEIARLALEHVTTDKVAYCRQFGETITEAGWPNCHLPSAVMGDRGELMTQQTRNAVKRLGIDIINTAPYRADWKAIVERTFRLCNDEVIAWLPGTTHLTDEEKRRRDYRLDACLDLHQFRKILIQLILEHNLKHYMPWYDLNEFHIADQVERYPIALWNWGRRNREGRGRMMPEEVIRRNLLYSGTASVTERKLYFEGMYYAYTRGDQEDWWLKAKRRGRDHVTVLYDPQNMNTLYVDLGKNLPPEPCTLIDWQSAYQGRDWFELQDYFARQHLEVVEAQERELHDHIQFHTKVEEVVAEGKAQTDEAWGRQGKRTLELPIPQARQIEMQKDYQDTSRPIGGQVPLLQSELGETGASAEEYEETEEDYIAPDQPIDLIKKWMERQDHDHS